MQRKKVRSEGTILQKSEVQMPQEVAVPASDTLILKILSLRLPDQDPKNFAIKVTFFDQLLVHAIIKSIGAKDEEPSNSIANGTMSYDPSDYEKMCLFADSPLVVHVQPLRNIDENISGHTMHGQQQLSSLSKMAQSSDISCCNVDILAIFLGEEDKQKICIRKRMEPMVQPSMKHRKSWDTLPLLTMELSAERDALNNEHHKVLREANWMKVTLVAAYNMYIPYENDYVYTAASKTPLYGDTKVGLVTYNQGYREPRRFNCINFFPKWENLRSGGDVFTRSDQKMQCTLEDIQNEDCIDLPYYLNRILPYHTAVWGSFHRTLMLKDTDRWLWRCLRNYKWPLEVHIYGETGGYSFMAFLNLFRLLYPGEHTVRLAVPLQWINAATMMKECGCDLLLTPNDRPPSITNERAPSPTATVQKTSKSSKVTTESVGTSVSTLTGQWRPTGADDNDAFVLVEIKLGRPLKEIVMPPRILKDELSAMLTNMESDAPKKRICYGRGQLERDWQKTVKSAANALRKVPYYGATEFCTFNRQLSETRTRVELMTSCWQDAAIYINNNFVVQQYLHSDEVFEELVMMAHACLMRSACAILVVNDNWNEIDPDVKAARHARQMQDTHHAMELYLRLVVDKPRDANNWRELSTCLKDVDIDWAITCLNKAVVLNPRHPLTLLSKGAMLFERNPTAAEPFFLALLAFCPEWVSAWTVASVYFYEREHYHMADLLMTYANKLRAIRSSEEFEFPRSWERELGDWWDPTPLLPGMSLYYDAADLLLRLRAVPLAEACMARVLAEGKESAAYYHLVGLCCRLRGDYEEAVCHITIGIGKYGEVNYLKSLEAECQHRLGNIKNSIESFEKAGSCINSFSILMSLACGDKQRARTILLDLVRRQASAYAWTALAEDWVMKADALEGQGDGVSDVISKEQYAARSCAIACAVQALKSDRRAGRAWAVLGKLVKPSARRYHCLRMANTCGWEMTEEEIQQVAKPSQHSVCHRVGTALRECRCHMCDKIRV